ncbi:uncharacterized protein SEPMUDRAFT_77818 [Sphaerulina musiva SO2202]|uniref:Uncharacterized protein n=1 Tax=Sphaerulina musiva (strain SO2202) TaxID=692275 RepID=N1QN31_SPHMS|nr:uncharacterized protein SEPMUDRAFT_77818 [Sphaerulina musiva SO2202]EMF17493.1 hypothetical protein SEPMUDRAFT_77818 [Sphaerulina musiva SO2202]
MGTCPGVSAGALSGAFIGVDAAFSAILRRDVGLCVVAGRFAGDFRVGVRNRVIGIAVCASYTERDGIPGKRSGSARCGVAISGISSSSSPWVDFLLCEAGRVTEGFLDGVCTADEFLAVGLLSSSSYDSAGGIPGNRSFVADLTAAGVRAAGVRGLDNDRDRLRELRSVLLLETRLAPFAGEAVLSNQASAAGCVFSGILSPSAVLGLELSDTDLRREDMVDRA